MGKDKRNGGLIEDRVIRQPMEQMRRKLKFKEKERRKEQRDQVKNQMFEHREAMKDVDPLQQHDFSMIKQIKEDKARKTLGMESSYKNNGGFNDQTSSMQQQQQLNPDATQQYDQGTTWQDIQSNYFKQLSGQEVDFHQPHVPQTQQPQMFRPQPYQQKQALQHMNYQQDQDTGTEMISSKPFIYKPKAQQEAQPVVVSQPKVIEQPQLIKKQQQRPQKVIEIDDPLDPRFGEKNFRDKDKKQEKQVDMPPPSQFSGVSQDIRKALGLGKSVASKPEQIINEQEEVKETPQLQNQSETRKLIPAALRRQMLLGQAAHQQTVKSKIIGPQMPLLQETVIQKPIQPASKLAKPNTAINSLLGAYSDDSDSDNDHVIVNKAQIEFKLPGSDLAFAPIKFDDPKSMEMDEELKRFMAEIGKE